MKILVLRQNLMKRLPLMSPTAVFSCFSPFWEVWRSGAGIPNWLVCLAKKPLAWRGFNRIFWEEGGAVLAVLICICFTDQWKKVSHGKTARHFILKRNFSNFLSRLCNSVNCVGQFTFIKERPIEKMELADTSFDQASPPHWGSFIDLKMVIAASALRLETSRSSKLRTQPQPAVLL